MKTAMLVLFVLLAPGSTLAQERSWQGGVRGGVVSEEKTHTGAIAGFEIAVPLSSDRLVFNPNVELGAADNFILSANADIALVITPRSPAQAWVGAGAGLMQRSSFLREERRGAVGNLLFGVAFGRSRWRPYVQLKVVFGQGEHYVFAGGVRF